LASHLHVDVRNGMDAFFPGRPEAQEYAVEIVQEAGEIVFVPSKWFHQGFMQCKI
jgi:oxalate decarboxylase/phosphoglucose isomerase-like protein (cupin superfamily)